MPKASARHILLKSEDECKKLKIEIENGKDFCDAAKQYSKCPSGSNGGELGEFFPGQMVPEFDKVVFNEEVGEIHGPIKTSFGYHLIEIINRS